MVDCFLEIWIPKVCAENTCFNESIFLSSCMGWALIVNCISLSDLITQRITQEIWFEYIMKSISSTILCYPRHEKARSGVTRMNLANLFSLSLLQVCDLLANNNIGLFFRVYHQMGEVAGTFSDFEIGFTGTSVDCH